MESAGSDDELVQQTGKSRPTPTPLGKGKAKQVDDIDRSEEDNVETTSATAKKGKGKELEQHNVETTSAPAHKGKGKEHQDKSNKTNKNDASLGSSTAAAATLGPTPLAAKSLKTSMKPCQTPTVNVPQENEDVEMIQDEPTLRGARLDLARMAQLNCIQIQLILGRRPR